MTAHITATLQNLLLRSLALPIGARQGRSGTPRASAPLDATETQPMLFRSEGFAEDLIDAYPTH